MRSGQAKAGKRRRVDERLLAEFDVLRRRSPKAGEAMLTILEFMATVDRRQAMRLIEAVSTVVVFAARRPALPEDGR